MRKMMKKTILLTLLMTAVATLAMGARKKAAPPVTVCDLRTERLVNPMSIATPVAMSV